RCGTTKLHVCSFVPGQRRPTPRSGAGGTDGRSRPMGAMRKAGVWLGLVEDDDERGYDDRGYRYNDDFADEDDVDEQALATTRTRVSERLAAEREARTDRATVRSITRPTSSTVSYPTRDNL